MAFIRHTSCDKCGSSDARAVYTGGSSFCFSCRRNGKPTSSPYLLEETPDDDEIARLPHDANFSYSPACVAWVSKYDVSIEELIKHKVYWSEERQQLIYTFWENSPGVGELLFWQARNFGSWAKTKYYTKGSPDSCLPFYLRRSTEMEHGKVNGGLVIVEDCLSAIKIARQVSSMPVLGSDLSMVKIKRLTSVLEASGGIVVWLDGNMFHHAQKIAQRLQMLGVEARAVYTELDPKEYSDTEIKRVLEVVDPST